MTSLFYLMANTPQRPRNFQWYWNSARDPWSSNEEEWEKYTDIENEIIEDAYNEKQSDVEIDGNLNINLEFLLQYNKIDQSDSRQIKRVQQENNQNIICSRRERFSFPLILPEEPVKNNELSSAEQ